MRLPATTTVASVVGGAPVASMTVTCVNARGCRTADCRRCAGSNAGSNKPSASVRPERLIVSPDHRVWRRREAERRLAGVVLQVAGSRSRTRSSMRFVATIPGAESQPGGDGKGDEGRREDQVHPALLPVIGPAITAGRPGPQEEEDEADQRQAECREGQNVAHRR